MHIQLIKKMKMKATELKQLNEFVMLNLSNNNLFNTFYPEDKEKILNILYNKDSKINNITNFLDSFKGIYVKRNVLNNFNISKGRQEVRRLINQPTTGDVFIDDEGNKYRIVETYNGIFQFCVDGSFHMGENGYSSMSGGFSFDIKVKGRKITSITVEELKKTKIKESRKFWFFMDNSSGGNRGLHFNHEVNIYTAE